MPKPSIWVSILGMLPTATTGALEPPTPVLQGIMPPRARPTGHSNLKTRGMTTRTVGRAAWSRLLAELQAATGRTDLAIAELAGVGVRAVQKWKAQEVTVSAESVVAVAAALGYPPAKALVDVGLLLPGEVAGIISPQALDSLAAEINTLLRSRLPAAWLDILRRMLRQTLDSWVEMRRLGAAAVDIVDRRAKVVRRGKTT